MPAAVIDFFARRKSGKTALMWHLLRQESARVGRPIECCECRRPHDGPPPFGKCVCGCFVFGIPSASAQLPLNLDFHAGEV